ncbi:MAG TPA: hypothetical protein VMH03_15730 [Terriglobales bacterium]|nr:hypothetical protein [Terriglobales bacterium]
MELSLNPELGLKWFEILMDQESFRFLVTITNDLPKRRRSIEAFPKCPERDALLAACDGAQCKAIPVFLEFLELMCSDPWSVRENTALHDRLLHAYALMAVISDDSRSLPGFRDMICPDIRYEQQGEFNLAVWEGKWNRPGEQQPSNVTREQTRRNWLRNENDGLYNTAQRLDPVAKAGELDSSATLGELDPLFPTEPLKPLSAVQLAFIRSKLREIGREAGLPKEHADFLVRMALDGAKQEDNPTAWRAIRDRKCDPLMARVRELLDHLRE